MSERAGELSEMDFDAAYERATHEQTYLGVIAGVALGTAGAVHLEAPPLTIPAVTNLKDKLQGVLAVGERAVEAWNRYLELGDAGESHNAHCLRGNLGGIKVVLVHLREIACLYEARPDGVPEFWPDNFGSRLRAITDELEEVAETLALGVDDDFCAEVERRIVEARSKGTRYEGPRGTGPEGTD